MAELSREELKKRFRNGSLAREENFADLIDSFVNKATDHIQVEEETGLGLTPNNKKFISFFSNELSRQNNSPSCSFNILNTKSNDKGLMLAVPEEGRPDRSVISVTSETNKNGALNVRVGIHTGAPTTDFDVNGMVAMKGRIGTYSDGLIDAKQIIADGKWHKVLTNLKGINALEITTAVCGPEGKYAMYYAVVMNAFGKSKRIRPLSELYSSWWHRLQFRWSDATRGVYDLEVRTACRYKTNPVITNRITKLWS